MKKVLIISILSLFSLPAFGEYISSNSYLEHLNNSTKDFDKISKISNSDINFYNLQKKYEKIIFEMNLKDADNISKLYCTSYNNKYSILEDNRTNKTCIKNYNNIGINLYCTEGISVYMVDYNWLEKLYGKGLSKEYRQWLSYLKNPVPFEEGLLNTDKKNVNNKITKLENFIKKYPNFVAIEDVMNELKKLKAAR